MDHPCARTVRGLKSEYTPEGDNVFSAGKSQRYKRDVESLALAIAGL